MISIHNPGFQTDIGEWGGTNVKSCTQVWKESSVW